MNILGAVYLIEHTTLYREIHKFQGTEVPKDSCPLILKEVVYHNAGAGEFIVPIINFNSWR